MLELFELSRFLFGKRVPAAGIRIADKAQAVRSRFLQNDKFEVLH